MLTLNSLLVVLVSVSRKTDGTLAFVEDNQFLRWVEADNMVLGLCTVLLYYLLAAHLVRDSRRQRRGAQAGFDPFVIGGDGRPRTGPAEKLAPAADAPLLRHRVRHRPPGHGSDQDRVTPGQ